jgi:hypothetical protein
LTKITRRELLTILAVAVVFVLFILITTREKAKRVPLDGKHQAFYEAIKKGRDRIETERGCITCHNPETIPLPKNHPPKEQCLICHKLDRARR